jgi:hypothetical protein
VGTDPVEARARRERQPSDTVRRRGTTAHAFHAYFHQPAARAIFVRYGFVLPDER